MRHHNSMRHRSSSEDNNSAAAAHQFQIPVEVGKQNPPSRRLMSEPKTYTRNVDGSPPEYMPGTRDKKYFEKTPGNHAGVRTACGEYNVPEAFMRIQRTRSTHYLMYNNELRVMRNKYESCPICNYLLAGLLTTQRATDLQY